MNFNFGEVLTRAWQITWKHKVLWIFGILAGCGQGSRFNSNNSTGSGDGGFGQPPPEFLRILDFIEQNLTAILIGFCILFLLIWAITIFLSTIGRIGLIRGVYQADAGAESLVFGQLFSESMPYFWRIFGLSLLVALPIFLVVAVVLAIVAAFAFSVQGSGEAAAMGALGMIPLILGCVCLMIPIMFVIGLIFRQASNAVVLEEMSVFPALSRGWDIFRENLGPVLLMGIILGVLGFVVSLVISIPLFIIAIPAVLAFAAGNGENWTPLIAAGVGFCLYLPILWLLTGILTTYIESVWTLTFLRLTRPVTPPLQPVAPEPVA